MKLPASFIPPLLVALSAFVGGCHTPQEPRLTITGTLNYDNFVVTPGCTIDVRLDDVTRADAPAITVSRQFINPRQSSPLPFDLFYTPSTIDQSHRYVIAARISCGGELLLTTDTAYPVLTMGNPTTVSLVLKPVASGTSTP